MTNEQSAVLVLEDSAGNYFLVPREALERGRVPAEHTAELEQDVRGHQDYMVFQLRTVLIGGGGGAAPPAAGIGQVTTQLLEERAGSRPR